MDTMFELAIDLRDKGQLQDSINVLNKILNDYPADTRKHKIYPVLGGLYLDLGENEKALTYFKKATDLRAESELASLGLYVVLVELDRDIEAIRELIRYLKVYPARLYKQTLEELLEGLDEGFMKDFEDEIRTLAHINGVNI